MNGREHSVLQWFADHIETCATTECVHQFIIGHNGGSGDRSSTDTKLYGPPGIGANTRMAADALSTWGEAESAMLGVLAAATEAEAIASLEKGDGFYNYRGTGFKVETLSMCSTPSTRLDALWYRARRRCLSLVMLVLAQSAWARTHVAS